MATVTNSIGTASRDYSTIALWEAALPASAVTAGNSYVGQCYNDAEFDFGTTKLTVGGTTTDATHTILLTTATGQGFRDNGSAASNALRYNASNGVAIKGNVGYDRLIDVSDNYVTFQNLQFKNTSASGNCAGIQVTGTNFTLDSCIVQNVGAASAAYTIDLSGTSGAAQNCLIVNDSSVALSCVNFGQSGSLINCTIVRPSNRTANGNGIRIAYSVTQTIQNCVIAGYGTAINKTGTGLSGSGNAIDTASYPSGVTGQTSLTIATEFVQPSNGSSVMDWRLNSTSVKCEDNGTNSGAPSTDIIGQAISNTTRDVGAWELQQGGGSPSGTLATTEAADAGAFAGTVADQGSLAATETTDTAAFAGAFGNSGSLAATETPDALAFSGTVADQGTLAATETADTLAFAGNADISGTLATTEGQDTAAFAGSAGNTGTLAATDTADVVAVSGSVSDQGTLAATEAADVLAFSGNADISGTLATTEAADILAFVGSSPVTGTLAATESPDVLAFASASTDGQTILTDRRGPSVALSRKRYEQLLEEIERENRELVKLEKKAQAAKAPKKVLKQVEQKAAKIERLETKLTDLEIEEDDMEVLRMIFRLAA